MECRRDGQSRGVDFKDRWKVTRERVLAMRAIWANAEAEFHGQFVDFDPIWCWPKPVQAGGPPILLGVGRPKECPSALWSTETAGYPWTALMM